MDYISIGRERMRHRITDNNANKGKLVTCPEMSEHCTSNAL